MNFLVVGEDALCCSLGERLVAEALPGWWPRNPSINTKGRTKLLVRIDKYVEQARHVQPVLCIADTDGGCAKTLLQQWRPRHAPPGFHIRLAVSEAESWVLADRQAFAHYFAVPVQQVPSRSDEIEDPKRLMLHLLRRSKKRCFRDEMVSETDPSKPGVGYNTHLCRFVQEKWRAAEASALSPSLARALTRLRAFANSDSTDIGRDERSHH